jgi:very-short-patch-repair endonuclease
MGEWSERSNSSTEVTPRSLGRLIGQVKHRARTGRLHRVHRGVYAVGHANLSREGRWKAATLVAEGAALSHRSAGEHWGLREPRGDVTHITAPRRVRAGSTVRVHRAARPPDELTIRDRIPVTALARTLLDVAAAEGAKAFERALREASFKRLPGLEALPTLIARYPGARGTARATRALADRTYAKRTRSELEAEFLDFCRARSIPLPETNVRISVAGRAFEVDCLWREEALVVELDGRSAHLIPEQVENDLLRDGLLQAHGLAVHRISALRMRSDPDGLELQLRTGLRGPSRS